MDTSLSLTPFVKDVNVYPYGQECNLEIKPLHLVRSFHNSTQAKNNDTTVSHIWYRKSKKVSIEHKSHLCLNVKESDTRIRNRTPEGKDNTESLPERKKQRLENVERVVIT